MNFMRRSGTWAKPAIVVVLGAGLLGGLLGCGGPGATDGSPIPSTGVPLAAEEARGAEPPADDPSLVRGPSGLHKKHPVSPPAIPGPAPDVPPIDPETTDPFAPPIAPPPAAPKPTSTGVPL